MRTNKKYLSESRRAIAIARKLAQQRGIKRIGPEVLAASLARVLGEKAKPCLNAAGILEDTGWLTSIPDGSPNELDQLPPARPNDDLARLLTTGLQGFAEGLLSPERALHILVSSCDLRTQLLAFSAPRLAAGMDPGADIYQTVRRVTRLLQTGYRIGRLRYGTALADGTTDFATGASDSNFEEVLHEIEVEKQELDQLLYSGPRGKPLSFFEKYMRELGPLAADVVTAVTINSVTPFTSHPISVHELAWTFHPRFPHEVFDELIVAVKLLQDRRSIRIFPEPETCQAESQILPAEEVLIEFGEYVRSCRRGSNEVGPTYGQMGVDDGDK